MEISKYSAGHRLIDWMMGEFDSKYKGDWNKERFSLYESPVCKPRADLDTIFFWKVYAQGWLARRSEAVFGTLTECAGNGGKMVEKLAEIPDSEAVRLKTAWEANLLPTEVQVAFQHGRGGWGVLGWAIKAAKKLVSLFGEGKPSYVSLWLRKFFCDERDSDKDLAEAINLQIEKEVIRKSSTDLYTSAKDARYFLEQRLVKNPEAHLCGVGIETLSFFFRDWIDVALWKYMWKHDYQNERFWQLVSEILGSMLELKDNKMDSVVNFLSFLTPKEIDDGIIAKINTTAYRFLSTGGYGEKVIREKLECLKSE